MSARLESQNASHGVEKERATAAPRPTLEDLNRWMVVGFDRLYGVAADSGLDEKQIGTYIRGQGNPTYGTMLKLCNGLKVSLATLIDKAEELHDKRHGR
jgi:hypothetical protein